MQGLCPVCCTGAVPSKEAYYNDLFRQSTRKHSTYPHRQSLEEAQCGPEGMAGSGQPRNTMELPQVDWFVYICLLLASPH